MIAVGVTYWLFFRLVLEYKKQNDFDPTLAEMCAAPLLMVTGLAGGRSLYIFR